MIDAFINTARVAFWIAVIIGFAVATDSGINQIQSTTPITIDGLLWGRTTFYAVMAFGMFFALIADFFSGETDGDG